jgi:chemotaxis protein methyltransferase CheR
MMDVIFLRNVPMYFEAETRRQILSRVHRVLRADGFLFLGSAETPRDLEGASEAVEVESYLSYKPKQLGKR